MKNIIREYFNETPKINSLKIIKEIGEGGNALVYEALDNNSNEKRAIKFLCEDCAKKKSTKYYRFESEFNNIKNFSSSNKTVVLHYFGYLDIEDQKFPYIVMDFYPDTLKTWIGRNPIESLKQASNFINDLSSSIEFIHSHKIVHRDLKPENIFFTSNSKPILGDFGISWFDPNIYERLMHTKSGERLANYLFSAPEQKTQNKPTPHPTMDIYALGQIIQWSIIGEVHFGTGRTLLSSKNPEYQALDKVVDELLQNSIEKRPQTITEALIKINTAIDMINKKTEGKPICFINVDYIIDKLNAHKNFLNKYKLLSQSTQRKINISVDMLKNNPKEIIKNSKTGYNPILRVDNVYRIIYQYVTKELDESGKRHFDIDLIDIQNIAKI